MGANFTLLSLGVGLTDSSTYIAGKGHRLTNINYKTLPDV